MDDANIKLKVENLSKAFGKKKIFENINLDFISGEIVVILGGSGSGKSVFLKTIIGLIEQDTGQIIFNNTIINIINRKISFFSKISVLFQSNALFDSLNVFENLAFPFLNQKLGVSQAKIEETLLAVGLEKDVCKLYLSELSGGMQKRVALARCLIKQPEIIFLDEPTSGLDFKNSELIFSLISQLSRDLKITFIIVTHDILIAPKIAKRALLLEAGNFHETNQESLFRNLNVG